MSQGATIHFVVVCLISQFSFWQYVLLFGGFVITAGLDENIFENVCN